ncbi:MAG: VirB4 family type IV secretion/conjugal transfer ATPase [Gammaproteobacteria bacterium]|nr:VirB4 family type IV secretion/conjugal transfer ATPase [Gammaproteobacteria bacterium]
MINMPKTVKREEQASKHINILMHYDDDTLLDKSGKLIKIIKLSGIDFITKDNQILNNYKNNRNNLLKNFSSSFAMYFWEVRRKAIEYPGGDFADSYASEVNDKYKHKIKLAEMFQKEIYLAIITKQSEGLISKGFDFLKQFNHALDKEAKQQYLIARHRELNDITKKVLNTLSDYHPKILSTYQKNDITFSEPLEFISKLINFDKFSVPVEISNAASALPRKRLFFNHRSGTIEMRSSDNSRQFAAVLTIKAYQPVTYAGMLDELSLLKIEYVITQSYRFYDRQVAKTKLRDQQKDMMQSKDESIRQTEQIDDAFDDTASGDVGYGKHHFTIVCYAESQEELNQHVATIVSKFSDIDIVCVREDVASECGFWAQLPGNFGYIMRAADISTKNMAAFTSLHNYSSGKMSGNHWGDAVTIFETLSGSPYYFNFHYKDVGNFLIFGAMGSGKTVLVGFLILQSMKFGGKRIIFDKDRGLEILVRAMGGVYEIIKPGIATGFNPCQLDDSPENRKFLSSLFKKILTTQNPLSESDNEIIDNAIDGMYRLHRGERQFCHIASFFGTKKNDSLRASFDQWHSGGIHAWVFDNEIDNLNLNADVLGFDLSHILSDPVCKTPALMYLTFRVEKAIEGHRGILFFDEGWLALNDDYFKELMNDWSRTPRKKNNIFGLATQVANDTANSSISKSINESAFCKIFFPNSSADKEVYVDAFGLTEHEYILVKTLPDDQHYFLLNHGRSTNKQSVVLRVNLSGMEDLIAIISAREETLIIFDKIRSEVGDDPKVWLPIFYERWALLKR